MHEIKLKTINLSLLLPHFCASLTFHISGNQDNSFKGCPVTEGISACQEEFPGVEAEGGDHPGSAAGGGETGWTPGIPGLPAARPGELPGASLRHCEEGQDQDQGEGCQEHRGGGRRAPGGQPLSVATQESHDVLQTLIIGHKLGF